MGRSSPCCTLWADGFNGLREHLVDRAGLVLVSPDAPEILEGIAAGRGWAYPLASAEWTSFLSDVGMESESGGVEPGGGRHFISLKMGRSRRSQPLDLVPLTNSVASGISWRG